MSSKKSKQTGLTTLTVLVKYDNDDLANCRDQAFQSCGEAITPILNISQHTEVFQWKMAPHKT